MSHDNFLRSLTSLIDEEQGFFALQGSHDAIHACVHQEVRIRQAIHRIETSLTKDQQGIFKGVDIGKASVMMVFMAFAQAVALKIPSVTRLVKRIAPVDAIVLISITFFESLGYHHDCEKWARSQHHHHANVVGSVGQGIELFLPYGLTIEELSALFVTHRSAIISAFMDKRVRANATAQNLRSLIAGQACWSRIQPTQAHWILLKSYFLEGKAKGMKIETYPDDAKAKE